jgi:alpha-D-xyloside xylohydrolase
VFINSSRYLTIYAGTGVRRDSPEAPEEQDRNSDKDWDAQPYSDAVEVLVPAVGVEVYIFAGPTPLDAVRRFNLYSGGGCLPPRWGLGFTSVFRHYIPQIRWNRRPGHFPQKDTLSIL